MTTPLTPESLAEIRARCEAHGPTDGDFAHFAALAHSDRIDLVTEVDRLNAARAAAQPSGDFEILRRLHEYRSECGNALFHEHADDMSAFEEDCCDRNAEHHEEQATEIESDIIANFDAMGHRLAALGGEVGRLRAELANVAPLTEPRLTAIRERHESTERNHSAGAREWPAGYFLEDWCADAQRDRAALLAEVGRILADLTEVRAERRELAKWKAEEQRAAISIALAAVDVGASLGGRFGLPEEATTVDALKAYAKRAEQWKAERLLLARALCCREAHFASALVEMQEEQASELAGRIVAAAAKEKADG